MNNFKVGVVDFFGILCPGIILMISIQVFLYSCNINLFQYTEPIFKINSDTLLGAILIVICYLFGFILRLISPDIVDSAATVYKKTINPLSIIQKKKLYKELKSKDKTEKGKRTLFNDYYIKLIEHDQKLPNFFWIESRYPYYIGNKYVYKKYLSSKDYKIMNNEKYHNKNNYNYWKVLITKHDLNLASLIFQAEASVRFMAGSFWSLNVGLISGILLITNNEKVPHLLGAIITLVYLISIMIILSKFKSQRQREVKILIDSILICSADHPEILERLNN